MDTTTFLVAGSSDEDMQHSRLLYTVRPNGLATDVGQRCRKSASKHMTLKHGMICSDGCDGELRSLMAMLIHWSFHKYMPDSCSIGTLVTFSGQST